MQLCRECRRHIKLTPCPFCGGNAVDPAAQQVSPGLSRAQILAGVALAGAVAAGCTDKQTSPVTSTAPSGETATPVHEDPSVQPMAPAYGAPPAVVDAGRMKGPSTAGAYGAPPAR